MKNKREKIFIKLGPLEIITEHLTKTGATVVVLVVLIFAAVILIKYLSKSAA